MHLFKFIYYRYKLDGHLISSFISFEVWPCSKTGGQVTWRPCRVGGSNHTVDRIICNGHLFRGPRSWLGSIQMKSSMTFIRGKRCIERKIISKM